MQILQSTEAISGRRAWVIWCALGAGVFAMFTSEAMAGALLPLIAHNLQITIGAASALIWGFAAGQMVGAWAIGMPLSRWSPRLVLSGLLGAFVLVQSTGLVVPFELAVMLRVVAGALMTAYMSTALAFAVRLQPPASAGRAAAIVFAGGTLGTTVGIPIATYLGDVFPWRDVFLLDTAVTLLAAICIFTISPGVRGVERSSIGELLRPLWNTRLWMTFATSGLTVGSALLGFAFFSTVLGEKTGLPPATVTLTLALYGVASLTGTLVAGRLAPTGATRVVAIGLVILTTALVSLSIGAGNVAVAVCSITAIGLSGVALNPALTVRNIQAGGSRPAVMSIAPTVATAGVFVATLSGSVAVSNLGLLAPYWIAALFAVVALGTLVLSVRPSPADAVDGVR